MQQRYNEVRDGGESIHNHLQSSAKVLKVNKGAPAWKAYMDYVNEIVIEGHVSAVINSARYLYNQVTRDEGRTDFAARRCVHHSQ